MKRSLYRIAALGVLLGSLSLSGVTSRPPARAADVGAGREGETTDGLLRMTKLDYKRLKDNAFRVLIEAKGEITPVIIEEKKAPWKANSGGEVLYAYIWSEVLALPNDFKPPTAMLLHLAQRNDTCRFGSIGLSKKPDGSMAIFRNMSCFLRGCNAEQLIDFLYMTHFERVALRKELRGYLEEK